MGPFVSVHARPAFGRHAFVFFLMVAFRSTRTFIPIILCGTFHKLSCPPPKKTKSRMLVQSNWLLQPAVQRQKRIAIASPKCIKEKTRIRSLSSLVPEISPSSNASFCLSPLLSAKVLDSRPRGQTPSWRSTSRLIDSQARVCSSRRSLLRQCVNALIKQ
jgi:hypothetical protein